MKTPKILLPALRQYAHNNGEGLLSGYDKKEVDKVVSILQTEITYLKKQLEENK